MEISRLESTHVGAVSMAQILRRPEISYSDLADHDKSLTSEEVEQVEITIKYAGYVERQEQEVARLKSMEEKKIPFVLHVIDGLKV